MIVDLEPKEEIITIIRPHRLAYLLSGMLGIIVFFSALMFSFPLFKLGITGVIIFSVMAGSSLLWVYRARLMQQHTLLLFTDRRFVHSVQHGLFGRSLFNHPYSSEWKATQSQTGLLSRILGLSTIELRTKKQRLSLPWVQGAAKVTEFMNEVQYLKSGHAKAKQEDK